MSLDFSLIETKPTEVFSENITHNLADMAKQVGVYEVLWRPDKCGFVHAGEIVERLENALALLTSDITYDAYNAKNGWGTRQDLIAFIKKVLKACREHPNAHIRVSI